MKKIILMITLASGMCSVMAQSEYYWYKGNKVYLTKNEKKKYLLVETDADHKAPVLKNKIATVLAKGELIESNIVNQANRHANRTNWMVIEGQQKLESESLSESVIYEAPFYSLKMKMQLCRMSFM